MKYFNLVAIVLLLSFSSVFSQNIDFSDENFPDKYDELDLAIQNLETGFTFFGKNDYTTALEYYLKANNFNPENADLNFMIGLCYFNSEASTKSITYFEKALKLNSKIDNTIYYYLGRVNQLNYKFTEAIDYFTKFKSVNNGKKFTNDEAEKYIQECKNAIELYKNPVDVEIKNLGDEVNSKFDDYTPVITADQSVMMFISKRETSTGGQKDKVDNKYYEDIYICEKENGTWSAPENPGSPLNSIDHDAVVGLSPDGQKLILYKVTNEGDLYLSKLEGDKWTDAVPFSENINSPYHETSASFSYNEKTLYFVSDMPGGFGGLDIYYSTLDETGNWSVAKNLGSIINTNYDEDAVFILSDDETLYFSSHGHNSIGGYDIFKSVKDEKGNWSKPENLGYPINTPDNDLYFTVAANGVDCYYSSSNVQGYGGQDIYMVSFNTKNEVVAQEDSVVFQEESPQVTLLKGIIVDAVTGTPVFAEIEIVDNESFETVATFTSNSKTGKYLVSLPSGKNYGISLMADKYLFHSENLNIPESEGYQEFEKDIRMQKVSIGSTIVLKNIFFDFNKSTLRSESNTELDRLIALMNQHPEISIEISGHTDNKGTAEYNLNLSKERAKSVVDYLVSKGISKDRLTYKGYGFSMPVDTNDTEEGRQNNRRTEFKIIE